MFSFSQIILIAQLLTIARTLIYYDTFANSKIKRKDGGREGRQAGSKIHHLLTHSCLLIQSSRSELGELSAVESFSCSACETQLHHGFLI